MCVGGCSLTVVVVVVVVVIVAVTVLCCWCNKFNATFSAVGSTMNGNAALKATDT